MKKMRNTEIAGFVMEHAAGNPVSFHMPGHKGANFYKRFGYDDFMNNFFDYDITEIEGADNLFQREGIIEVVSKKYAKLYGVKESLLLINGTSCGLISAILATVPPGKKLILARNSHKSVFNALTLGGIEPVYAYPEIMEGWDISGEITPGKIEKLLKDNPDAAAVILPSPNYYGICSDIKRIAEVVHQFGKILIVDQAHGAHLKFFNELKIEGFPLAAEKAGADIVVNSTHKTLASLTQTAVMNVCSDRVDLELLEDKLQMMESTSPSYILMASLDINASILEEHGVQLFKEWQANLEYFYEEAKAIEGLKIMDNIPGLDTTKINIDLSGKGYSGRQLEKILIQNYGIFGELNTGKILMLMTGIGNTREDYNKLLLALENISMEEGLKTWENPSMMGVKTLEILDQVGKTCGKSVIPYPPGIPLICPGEVISRENADLILELLTNGEKILGLTPEGKIHTK